MKLAFLIPLFGVIACSPLPRDAAGTSKHIKQTGSMRVGIVSGTKDSGAGIRIVEELALNYDAALDWSNGPASILLRELDQGKLDLVIGEFGRSSPTSKEASLSAAIGLPEPRDGMLPVLRLARKKGENRLITISDKMAMQ